MTPQEQPDSRATTWQDVAEYFLGDYVWEHTPEECRKEAYRLSIEMDSLAYTCPKCGGKHVAQPDFCTYCGFYMLGTPDSQAGDELAALERQQLGKESQRVSRTSLRAILEEARTFDEAIAAIEALVPEKIAPNASSDWQRGFDEAIDQIHQNFNGQTANERKQA